MQISSIDSDYSSRRNLFIRYANSFMSKPESSPEDAAEKANKANPETKADKVKGIETLTIFPKQVIEGKTVIIA